MLYEVITGDGDGDGEGDGDGGGGARNARDLGCPNDCGLCHNHNQRTCTA